jgi:hypothetical protein
LSDAFFQTFSTSFLILGEFCSSWNHKWLRLHGQCHLVCSVLQSFWNETIYYNKTNSMNIHAAVLSRA